MRVKQQAVSFKLSVKALLVLCIATCFLVGSLFVTTGRRQSLNSTNDLYPSNLEHFAISSIPNRVEKLNAISTHGSSDYKRKLSERSTGGGLIEEVKKAHLALQSLDKTISTLEMELAAARIDNYRSTSEATAVLEDVPTSNLSFEKQKAFAVIGINTAFSSKRRRESLRQTWLPKGNSLKKLEKEKGIVIRFVIGHSTRAGGGALDGAIDAEDAEHHDFLRLNHVEGYHQLSSKTRLFFSTAVSIWDAHFYVKVDDDIHVNLGMLMNTLSQYKSQPRTYIGCMKSGPVLFHKGVKYHEPEFWKFGEEGNNYFRHASGQIYAISKDLALYISANSYANEDVSLGSWFVGSEVEHLDERSMCCKTLNDCELRKESGNMCIASFDWSCSGICNSAERIKEVHNACGEGGEALWNVDL